jgi:hypothetical protein
MWKLAILFLSCPFTQAIMEGQKAASRTPGAHPMDKEHHTSHFREEANHEIGRLEAMLRDPRISEEERDVVLAMLKFYEEAKTVEG